MQIIKPQGGKIEINLFASRAQEASRSLSLSLRMCARVTLHSSKLSNKKLLDSNRSRIYWICRHGSRRSFRARKARRYTSPPRCSSVHPRRPRYSGQVKFSAWFLRKCKESKKKKKEVKNLEVWMLHLQLLLYWSSTWENETRLVFKSKRRV